MARVPLICFALVEWHLPDRVLRQFGHPQHEPEPMEEYRRVDGRGRAKTDWTLYHRHHIEIWGHRSQHIVQPRAETEGGMDVDDYLRWYRPRTVPYLSQPPERPPSEYYPRGYVERFMVRVVTVLVHRSQITIIILSD